MTLQPKGGAEQDNLASVPVVLHPHVFLRASGTSEIGLECYDAADATAALDTDNSENQTSETYRISGQQEKSRMVTFNFFLYILEFKVKNKYQIPYISKNWLLSILIIITIYFTFSYSLQLNVGSRL